MVDHTIKALRKALWKRDRGAHSRKVAGRSFKTVAETVTDQAALGLRPF
jgi:hypothetical protein